MHRYVKPNRSPENSNQRGCVSLTTFHRRRQAKMPKGVRDRKAGVAVSTLGSSGGVQVM